MRTKKYYKLQKHIHSGIGRNRTYSAKSNRLWLEECMILRYFQPISNHRFATVYSVITVCPDSPTSAQSQILRKEKLTFLTFHPVCYHSKTLVGCFLTVKNHFSCGSAISTHLLFYKVSAVIYQVLIHYNL